MRIGLVLGMFNNDYCNNIVKYVANEISSRNAQLVVIECCDLNINTPENITESLMYKIVESDCLDGIIIITGTMSSINTKELFETFFDKIDKPVVSLGVALNGIPSFINDYHAGFDAIISHFASHNRKSLAFISEPLSSHISQEKYKAFFDAADKHGLQIPSHLVIEGTFGYLSGYNCGKKLIPFIKNGSVDAVVCTDDKLAMTAIKCFKENNIRIPEDIVISGYNNLDIARLSNPVLTTVDRKLGQVLPKAIAVLFEQIFGHKNSQIYSYAPELVAGQSCGCGTKSIEDHDFMYPWTSFNGLRGVISGLSNEEMKTKLTEHLNDNNVSHCYIIQNLNPVRLTIPQQENPKSTLFFGYSGGRIVTYPKPFHLPEILPKHILADIKEPVVIKQLIMNKVHYGFLIISTDSYMAEFIDNLAIELSQYFTYHYVMSEQERVKREAAFTHESLMISNKRLNELTVKENLDRLINIRHLASNMLQSRKGSNGEYVLIIVEIDNFHEINSRHGFSEGELVISCVSNILSNSIRDDDFLSHQCCERYVLLVKNIQSNPTVTISNRFIRALNELNCSLKKPYTISFSWGYAMANVENSFEAAYNEAEQCLLTNKQKCMPRN